MEGSKGFGIFLEWLSDSHFLFLLNLKNTIGLKIIMAKTNGLFWRLPSGKLRSLLRTPNSQHLLMDFDLETESGWLTCDRDEANNLQQLTGGYWGYMCMSYGGFNGEILGRSYGIFHQREMKKEVLPANYNRKTMKQPKCGNHNGEII